MTVHCCLVVTCWERADLLALVGDVYCICVTFQYGILGQVWYLILSFPDLRCLSNFMQSFWKPITALASLHISTVSPEFSLVSHTKYENKAVPRGLAMLVRVKRSGIDAIKYHT